MRSSFERARRGSTQLSGISESAAIVLQPSIHNASYGGGSKKGVQIAQSVRSSVSRERGSSGLRQSQPQPTELTKQDSNYNSLVQTKAQKEKLNPDLKYVKRDSATHQIAKESAQKLRIKKNGTGISLNDAVQRRSTTKSPILQPQTDSRNMDLATLKFTEATPLPFQDYADTEVGRKRTQTQIITSPIQVVTKMKMHNENTAKSGANPDPPVTSQYARFRLQESIKALARPKNVPICGPRARELANIVFEQRIASEFSQAHTSKNQQLKEKISQYENQNFSGPYYMTKEFRSHKVGEKTSQSQPYYQPNVVHPKTSRPQSHYTKEVRMQIKMDNLIQEEAINSISRQLNRPLSGRAEATAHVLRLNELVSVFPTYAFNSLGTQGLAQDLSVKGESRSKKESSNLVKVPSGQRGLELLNVLSVNSSNQVASARLKKAISKNFNQTNTESSRRLSHPKSGTVSIAQLFTVRGNSLPASGTNSSHHASKKGFIIQRPNKPEAQIVGDELKVSKNKIFDTADTISRQSRIDAYETSKLQQKQEATFTHKQVSQERKTDVTQVLSSKLLPGSESESQIMTPTPLIIEQSFSKNPNSLAFRPADSPLLKNVTVFEKLASITHELADNYEVVTGEGTPADGNTTVLIGGPGNVFVNDQEQMGELKGYRADSVEMSLQEDQIKNYIQFEPKFLKSANKSPQAQGSPDLLQQYSSQLYLGQKLNDILGLPAQQLPFAKNVPDLQSIGSEEITKAQYYGSDVNSAVASSPNALSIEKINQQKYSALVSRSRMTRLRQEERRTKLRLASAHTHLNNSSCKRCAVQEIESTKKLVDKSYQSTSRTKVYFKPSIVEIHEESLPAQGHGHYLNKNAQGNNGSQCYLLGPNVSQDQQVNGGTARDESQGLNMRASMDSNQMQALFNACEEGMNTMNEFASNPETREFILYLQQVQPDLLTQQTTREEKRLNSTSSQSLKRVRTANEPKSATLGTLKLTHQNSLLLPRNELKSAFLRDADGEQGIVSSQGVIVEENYDDGRLGAAKRLETNQKQVNSQAVLNSQETLRGLADLNAGLEDREVSFELTKADERTSKRLSNEAIDVREDLAGDEKFNFKEDQPVNYERQVQMMEDIFKQIQQYRESATRTTVKSQKIIFQPTLREFRRLDLKPLHMPRRRYPQRNDYSTQEARLQPRLRKSKTRTSRSHRSAGMQSYDGQPDRALRLENTQVGIRGQFASLMHRKRAEKMVTWDVEPPKSFHNATTPYAQSSSRSQYQEQAPQQAYYATDSHFEPYLAAKYQMNSAYASVAKPQMSAIHEVSSVSRREDTMANATRTTPTATQAAQSQYREIEPDVREIMHELMNEKSQKSQNPTEDGKATNQSKTGVSRNSEIEAEKQKRSYIPGWTDRTTPHRRGKPVGAEYSTQESKGSADEKDKQDDTLLVIFRNKQLANAIANKKDGRESTKVDLKPDTVEWSQISNQPLKKTDALGNLLSHKGNVITRGFNAAQQRKTRIVCTNDPQLLEHATLKNLFDEGRHRITNYIHKLGPPKTKRRELSKQQWRRIQRAQFNYENLEEKVKVKRTASITARSPSQLTSDTMGHKKKNGKSKGLSQQKVTMPSSEHIAEEPKRMIEGDLFSFSNPERYKTDQLKEQALALLVPGYLQYVYDLN